MIKQLDFQDKCNNLAFLIIILVITMIARIVADGGGQQLEYCLYKAQENQYIIENAKVHKQEDRSFKILNISIIPITETIIEYKIENKKYLTEVYSYSKLEVHNGTIPIAVNIHNYNRIVRCIPWAIQNGYEFFWNWVVLGGLLIVLIKKEEIIDLLRRKQRKRTERVLAIENVNKTQIRKAREKEKQTALLYYIKREEVLNEEFCEKIKERMQDNDISWSEDWLWCLRFLSSDKIMFLNGIWDNPIYITETLAMRQKGLPNDYWIIDRKDNYYICCRRGHERIYAFSTNLGITNTQYEDIYDYIQKSISK